MNKGARGFMLLELMLAVAVLGVGLFSVFRAMSSALKTHQAAGDAFEASLALGAKAWEWRQTGAFPRTGPDETDSRWTWASDVVSEDPSGETLSLALSWTSRGIPREAKTYDHRA